MRLTPLYLAIVLADRFAETTPRSRPQKQTTWSPGISVVIPDRDAPELLNEALDSVVAALGSISEPHQLIVVANGAPTERYASVLQRHPDVELIHDPQPCGFSTAIHRGMEPVRHDWTLLLNNDMTVEPSTLAGLAKLRADDVFAIAPQIQQRSSNGRREETGFVDWYVDGDGIHVYHAPVPRDDTPRSHLCASGGAALFRTASLRRYARDARAYDPFYWEDVEWGLRAQRDGFRVLYCPTVKAKHRHRATTARFYSADHIERVSERNRLLFDLRNAATERHAEQLMQAVCDQPYASQHELASPIVAMQVLRHRWRARQRLVPSLPPPVAQPLGEVIKHDSSFSFKLGNNRKQARVLLITPFCIFPPCHGGARRVEGLLQYLRRDFEVVLISDEALLYDMRSFAYFDGLHAVQLVQRRESQGANKEVDLEKRIDTHCHESLVRVVRQALWQYRPAAVQIEHVELAWLSRLRMPGQKWILGLHDAYVASDFSDPQAPARLDRHLVESYDAVTVCSAEDQALLGHPRTVCVPNGTAIGPSDYVPSGSAQLLFIGPFRYAQNLQGIREFLRVAYPEVKAAVPAVQLLVLGGDRAQEAIAGDDAFAQPGVTVIGHRDDVQGMLRASALTLNPLSGIRGSSIKVIESLSAGRACVSTEEGARGFIDVGLSGLVTASDVAAMAAPIIRLLKDSQQRHRIERDDASRLERFQWRHCAAIQAELYRTLIGNGHA